MKSTGTGANRGSGSFSNLKLAQGRPGVKEGGTLGGGHPHRPACFQKIPTKKFVPLCSIENAGGRPPAGVVESAEAQTSSETEDARAGDLADVVRRGLLQPVVDLQDVGLVEKVEAIDAESEAEVTEGELLLHARVDDGDVVQPERVRAVRGLDVLRRSRDVLVGRQVHALEVRNRVALAAVEVQRDVEAPRMVGSDLVQAVDAVGPLAVDVDAALGARAGARTLENGVALAGAATQELGGVRVGAGGNLAPVPIGVGDVAAQHPAVGQ